MCLAQGPQRSDTSEAGTRSPSVSTQALYHWATALPPTLHVTLQEYERHFSGIWGRFPESRIFLHKCCKIRYKMHSHKASICISLNRTLFLPPKGIADSFTSTSSIIFSGPSIGFSVCQLVNLWRISPSHNFNCIGSHFDFYDRWVLRLATSGIQFGVGHRI